MKWRKLGVVFQPSGEFPWARTHAALPVPMRLDDNLLRIFFGTRDESQRSHVGHVDIEIGSQPRVRAVGTEPVLSPGAVDSFDDRGIGPGNIVTAGGEAQFYYMGWNIADDGRWRNSIGMATGDPYVPYFKRPAKGPLINCMPPDSYSLSYPWVERQTDDSWHMWYGTHLADNFGPKTMRHAIRHAFSHNGIDWVRSVEAAIMPDGGDHAFARPCVVRDGGRLLMWYAVRGDTYRIGYAASEDGKCWIRHDDDVGIDVSEDGWDSEMLCYPFVFDHNGERYLFYNGNGYGRTGFGIAILEKD